MCVCVYPCARHRAPILPLLPPSCSPQAKELILKKELHLPLLRKWMGLPSRYAVRKDVEEQYGVHVSLGWVRA